MAETAIWQHSLSGQSKHTVYMECIRDISNTLGGIRM